MSFSLHKYMIYLFIAVYHLNMSADMCQVSDANTSSTSAPSSSSEALFLPVYLSDNSILERTRFFSKHGQTKDQCLDYLKSVDSVALLNNRAATDEEERFPIAFAISAHHQVK